MKALNQAVSAQELTQQESLPFFRKFFIIAILVLAAVWVGYTETNSITVLLAAGVAVYMAMNIGANDVANNVGPSVGAGVLSLGAAIVIAGIFEAAGALIAGGGVVKTIRKGIIDPAMIGDNDTFIWLMIAALLAGAIWLNVATFFRAPVSTTHSIVGGVMGAGMAAAGTYEIVNWPKMGEIALSWVISPVLGGIIAVIFLYAIKRLITYNENMIGAARKYVPILIGLMSWAFVVYLMLKGLKNIWKVEFEFALSVGAVVAIAVMVFMYFSIKKMARNLDNSKASINRMFFVPIMFAVAFLSFAHGANDVANAIGPFAAIVDAVEHGGSSFKAAIPLWVMFIGAFGISIGLWLFGPKLIRTVGSEITEMDPIRAFCIAMAAAITVIIASEREIPVSTTHIAVGAVFGVGFLRELIKGNYARMIAEIKSHHHDSDEEEVEAFLAKFQNSTIDERGKMLKDLRGKKQPLLTKKERKALGKEQHHQLVQRQAFYKIVAAWVITVPASGIMAGLIFFTIRGFMLP